MAWSVLARLLFTAAVAYTAFLIRPVGPGPLLNVAFGLALAGVAIAFEMRLRDLPLTSLLGALLGGAVGLGIAKGIGTALFWADTGHERVAFLHGFVLLLLVYVGLVLGGRRGEWLEPSRLIGLFRATGPQRRYRILDTSVIIDGRIADLCDTGFVDGTLVIPQFVLKELQLVADSGDSMKRNRGRRGLDILQKIQKMAGVEVMISDADYPDVREVDLKLIELARSLQGKIVTNDFNINKVAQLRGVQVLNINELANALKPVVLPGEVMKVFILKEGKEYNQGVAYLDDGTMVVVDNARRMIGKTIDVVVTSVLQTTAGKMIFGRFIDPAMAQQSGHGAAATDRDEPRRSARPAPVAAGPAPAHVPATTVAASGAAPIAPIEAAPPNNGT
ncbi:MAG: PIN/TRAM domain-containing protein [Acidobacteriota bacterium]